MTNKILYILFSLPKGGKERRFLELVRDIENNPQVESFILILTPRIEYHEIYNFKNLLVLKKQGKFRIFGFFTQIRKIVISFSPTLIHCWGRTPSFLSGIIGLLYSIPVVSSYINDVPPKEAGFYKRLFTWFLCKTCKKVLSNTQAGLKAFNVSAEKGYCIYNGFDFKRLVGMRSKEEVRKNLAISTPYVIGMVGALEPRKDFSTFIMVAQRLIQKRRDITFLIIGDGALIDNLKNMVSSEDADYFRFTGRLDHVEEVINIFDIGILLSNLLIHGEGISNSILEYMALGKPVIATNGGGNSEIVVQEESGYLITDNNVQEILERTQELIESPQKREKLGLKGRQIVAEKFEMSMMTNRFLDLYFSTISKV